MSIEQRLGVCFALLMTSLAIMLGVKSEGNELGVMSLLLFSSYILFISLPKLPKE